MNNVLLSISEVIWMADIIVVCWEGIDYHKIQCSNKQQLHMSSLSILNASYSFQEKNLISFLCQMHIKEIFEYNTQW